ncbi:hypothetical protein BJV82DRAFT_610631 [Fennellomyces sp. T-0311]|nr:hypothetical protein BJV82DRAFT_610631 [Fennellomyces sp. T-0311]
MKRVLSYVIRRAIHIVSLFMNRYPLNPTLTQTAQKTQMPCRVVSILLPIIDNLLIMQLLPQCDRWSYVLSECT